MTDHQTSDSKALVTRSTGDVQAAAPQPAVTHTHVYKVRKMHKTSWLGAILRPIATAAALCMVGVVGFSAWNAYASDEAKRLLHAKLVHADKSLFRVLQPDPRKPRPGEVELVLRKEDGKLVRVIAGKSEATTFLNRSLRYVADRRLATQARLESDIGRVFETAFADRHESVTRYADWFFEWGQSWKILWEGLKGGTANGMKMGLSRTEMTDAARHQIEEHLLRGFTQYVLKPEQRDPVIAAGMRQALTEAHGEYRATLAGLEDRLQIFIQRHGRYVEPINAEKAVSIKLDWDAQQWKAPRYAAEGSAMRALGSAAVIGGSAIVLRPALQAATVRVMTAVTGRLLVSAEAVIGGSVAGSAFPVVGTVLGAAAGVGIDWAISQVSASWQRPDFVEVNVAAVDATMAEWRMKATPPSVRAMEAWFADTERLIANYRSEIDPPDRQIRIYTQ